MIELDEDTIWVRNFLLKNKYAEKLKGDEQIISRCVDMIESLVLNVPEKKNKALISEARIFLNMLVGHLRYGPSSTFRTPEEQYEMNRKLMKW